MPQTNYAPIQHYRSTTAGSSPSAGALQPGELAINLQDEKLFFKNAAGVVKTLADAAVLASTVTVNGTQTLTNKTLTFPVIGTISNGGTLTLPSTTDTLVGRATTDTLTNKTLSGAVINSGYTEQVYAVSGTTPAISPTNGSIQTWTLTGNSTPTSGTWANGQSITLMVDDGTAYIVTWTSMGVIWKTNGGGAPPLVTSGYTTIVLWKVGGSIYGARVGNA